MIDKLLKILCGTIVAFLLLVLSGAWMMGVADCYGWTTTQQRVWEERQILNHQISRYNEQLRQNLHDWQMQQQKQAQENFNWDKYGSPTSDRPNSYNGNHGDWHQDDWHDDWND